VAARVPAEDWIQKVKLARALVLLLAGWLLAGQDRLEVVRVAVIKGMRVIQQNGKITETACEEPVIAERIPKKLLDTPAPEPAGATIRQVLENRADGTPGEEVLEDPEFFEALHTAGTIPDAIAFAKKNHDTLGWLSQDYAGDRILWCHSPSILIVRIPAKRLTMVAATHFGDASIARSLLALTFFSEVAKMPVAESDTLIASGQVRKALDAYPEIANVPDVTLLKIFAEQGLPETEASATAVIKAHPSLPTAWFYYGQYLENNKRYREAAACFEKITMHQPPWHNWTVAAAKKELTYLKSY
jgi:tetratricopeptide (TPR) repeat protein